MASHFASSRRLAPHPAGPVPAPQTRCPPPSPGAPLADPVRIPRARSCLRGGGVLCEVAAGPAALVIAHAGGLAGLRVRAALNRAGAAEPSSSMVVSCVL